MELYHFGRRPLFRLFMVLLVLIQFVSPAPSKVHRRISDECDWFGSGLDDAPSPVQGVRPLYLRCRAGTIQWEYPRGALRVVLRVGRTGGDFQGCVKVAGNSTGANVYLEGSEKLEILHKHDAKQELRCFRSTKGQAALFMEARSQESTKKTMFELVYDLQPIQPDAFSECRPCTDKELIYSFCTSDFVIRGTISSLYQNEPMQRTELAIRDRRILRDSEPGLFRPHTKTGVVYRPLHCGTKAGKGEFLFLGRWKLGEPVLTCAPRWTEWKKVRRRADFAECMLD